MRTFLTLLFLVPAAANAQGDADRLLWVPNPRAANGGWVADPAGHLEPATVASINKVASSLEAETSAELAVVVLDSLDNLEPGSAALLLHRRWGVGKAARDNGIVLLWSPALRRIFVSVGYGLEGVLPDARAGRIQDEAIIPHFRRDEFDAGILAGVNALADAAREEKYSGATRARIDGRAPGVVQRVRDGGGVVLGGIFATVFALIAGLVGWARRPRRCPRGHGRMTLLDETRDDRELTSEEVLEENLKSMNYDVWICGQCPERVIVPHSRWFTSYRQCPRCERKTLKVTRSTVSAATYSSTGSALENRRCRNCSFSDSKTIILPMLTRSSSSSGGSSGFSSGGGSSFGGGSSGGGGAGRSY
jgi:uncharacterized protein